MSASVLQVRNLCVQYETDAGPIKAAEDVTFDLARGERMGLVGESGSGKSTTVLALLRMVTPPGRIRGGQVLLDGADLMALSPEQMRRMRGSAISLIPQAAMNSLNPVMRVRDHFYDTIYAHDRTMNRARLAEHTATLIEAVGLRPNVLGMFPHELSGGMKQRVCIAMGICLRPKVIIADEPTSALDVVVQRQVMETLGRIQRQLEASIILVGHDMGLMAQFVDKIGIMYAGRLVELGPVTDVFRLPLHPYTRLLINTLPSLDAKAVFKGIPGQTPSLLNAPPGCAFHERCPDAVGGCWTTPQVLTEVLPGRWVACPCHAGAAA
jgi:oligopeptide/dipeptide ABC transporter ATP-binding protein